MSGQKGFNSQTGRVAHNMRVSSELYEEIRMLKLQIANMKNHINTIQTKLEMACNRNSELESVIKEESILDDIKIRYPYLYSHVLCVHENVTNNNSHQNRFNDEIKSFYLQYSSFGEDEYNILSRDFGFPSFNTVCNKR